MSITSDSPSESDGLSATLSNGTANAGALLTVSVVASVVFIDKLVEMVGGAVVEGVGGTTDIAVVKTAGVEVGGAADMLLGVAADSVMGGALDSVMGGAVDSVMGGALDSVIGGASDSVMGGAADSAVGVAADVLVANEETSLTADLVVDVVGNESAIRVGGAADTVVEDKVAVDNITLVVGGAVVLAIKVGGAALEVIVTTVGSFMDRVAVEEAATENVTEDSTVVALTITGAVVETKGVDKVGKVEGTVELVPSDKMGIAVVESLLTGDSVKMPF